MKRTNKVVPNGGGVILGGYTFITSDATTSAKSYETGCSSSRTDLCGGRPERAVPTATLRMYPALWRRAAAKTASLPVALGRVEWDIAWHLLFETGEVVGSHPPGGCRFGCL